MKLTKLTKSAQFALQARRGAAMVEYALLAALIALVVSVAATALGTSLKSKLLAVAASV